MSGLSEADKNVLRTKAYLATALGVDPLLIAVEAIVARVVKQALTEAADAITEFDPSDKYHAEDHQEPGYYGALSRAESLLRGEIRTWRDSPANAHTT